jgi:hypothetical protein
MKKKENSRRNFIRKSAYVAPAIITLAVAPSYAKASSLKIEPKPKPKPKPK